MKVIVDASVALAWYLNEGSSLANAAMRQLIAEELAAVVPPLWRVEVANGLLISERRGRLSRAEADEALRRLHTMPVEVQPTPSLASIVDLARGHRLTAYDATYLALAQHLKLPLAMLDQQLHAVAAASGVAIFAATESG